MLGPIVDPTELLLQSFVLASRDSDPNARYCTLTTIDEAGFPVSRTVTVREIDAQGIVIYINERSPKVEQLKNNPNFELLFFWPSLLRQFRVRGDYQIFPHANQRQSWQGKPYTGKLYDLFQSCEKPQSSILSSRGNYRQRMQRLKQRFAESDLLQMPAELVSLRFKPDYIESWIGSMQDGMHDRRLYQRTKKGWQCQLLVP